MLENQTVKEQYTISTNPVFEFGVRFFSPQDISCYEYNPNTKAETELTSGTDYSVDEKPDYSSGAKVTLLGPLTSGNILTIVRAVLPEQNVSLPNFGKIPSKSLEDQLDRQTAVQQQNVDLAKMTIRMPYGVSSDTTPDDYMSSFVRDVVGSGGGGGGGIANYASSAGALVSSAENALIGKAVVSGGIAMANSGTANYAKSAGYVGPFALKTAGSGNSMTAGMNSGYVYAGGSQYLVSGFDSDHTPFGDGETLYLTMLSSGGAISSGLVTSPSGMSSDTVIVRVASRMPDSDETEQLQFGDITTVPWELNGGGGAIGNLGLISKAWGSHTAEADGLVMAAAVMTSASTPGASAFVSAGGKQITFAQVPQGGITSAAYGCTTMISVSSGQTWSAGSLNNTSDCQLYFFALSAGN